MSTDRTPSTSRHLRLLGVAAVCTVVAGWGGTAGGAVRASGAPAVQPPFVASLERVPVWNGLYCRSVAGRGPAWHSGSDFATYWAERRHHEHVATITAPGEILDDWTTIAAFTRDVATPMVEAGDLIAPPTEPSDVVSARAAVAAFDHEVCGVG